MRGGGNLMTARVSMLLKSRASPDMLPFSLCNKKKTCISAHEQTPLSNNTIDSFLRFGEVGRAKHLTATLHIWAGGGGRWHHFVKKFPGFARSSFWLGKYKIENLGVGDGMDTDRARTRDRRVFISH